jgi:hypothetical protein
MPGDSYHRNNSERDCRGERPVPSRLRFGGNDSNVLDVKGAGLLVDGLKKRWSRDAPIW